MKRKTSYYTILIISLLVAFCRSTTNVVAASLLDTIKDVAYNLHNRCEFHGFLQQSLEESSFPKCIYQYMAGCWFQQDEQDHLSLRMICWQKELKSNQDL